MEPTLYPGIMEWQRNVNILQNNIDQYLPLLQIKDEIQFDLLKTIIEIVRNLTTEFVKNEFKPPFSNQNNKAADV